MGLELDPVTADGTGVLEYGVYGGFVDGIKRYRSKMERVGGWDKARGRKNKYGCNAALWGGLGKWCYGEGGGEVWEWVFGNLTREEVMWSNGNGHTLVHKLAQRCAMASLEEVCRRWDGGWGRDKDGMMPSDLAKVEGWKKGEVWLREEEERRGCKDIETDMEAV